MPNMPEMPENEEQPQVPSEVEQADEREAQGEPMPLADNPEEVQEETRE